MALHTGFRRWCPSQAGQGLDCGARHGATDNKRTIGVRIARHAELGHEQLAVLNHVRLADADSQRLERRLRALCNMAEQRLRREVIEMGRRKWVAEPDVGRVANGVPTGWTVSGRSATRSSRKSRKSSGEP